jgi:Fe-S oxidoreductase
MYGERIMEAFREFKSIWDPDGRMNPGKVVDALPLDHNLRLGNRYDAPSLETVFRFPKDESSFSRAMLRCVGVGKCRSQRSGTMCPSYRATMEEQHSTRGRARLLFEMLRGDVLTDGWRSEPVREALDLCLACKGCKGDCPVDVDMATYKAEFLHHYYKGRWRPRQAYAFGMIDTWSRYASRMPGLVNFMTQTPGLSRLSKAVAGIPAQRRIPAYARQTFKDWFAARDTARSSDRAVILWADTFNNYFHPHIARAGVQVLEAAGFKVRVPRQHLCCGRPLYDFGMLQRARQYLQTIMRTLRDAIDEGIPIVGLEPSCVSVFREELVNLFPDSEVAHRLKEQTFTLGEFLDHKAQWRPPQLRREALVHAHCHHKSVLSVDGERSLLDRMGLDYQWLDDGCCGMAGSFGFERGKYDISVAIGEQGILPAARTADETTLIISDGFSCREQVSQTTGRRVHHTAEVLAMALDPDLADG